MPYPNEHSARLRNPGDFAKVGWSRTAGGIIYGKIKVPKTIGIIRGKLKGKSKPTDFPIPQALRFNKANWTVAAAKKWLTDNNVKYVLFEPAKKEDKMAAELNVDEIAKMTDIEAGRHFRFLIGENAPEEAETIHFAGSRLTVKEIEEMDDTELGKLVKERIAESAANKEIRIELTYADVATQPVDEAEESDTVDIAEFVKIGVDKQEKLKTYKFMGFPIFRTGKHNGEDYKISDLDEIVKNFDKVLLEPVVELDHGEGKAVGPAVGWVDKLRRKGDILLADLRQIPGKVYELIMAGAYKNPSITMYRNYIDSKGIKHGKTLASVALLGKAIPAVKGLLPKGKLADIAALYEASKEHNEVETYDMNFDDIFTAKEEATDVDAETTANEAGGDTTPSAVEKKDGEDMAEDKAKVATEEKVKVDTEEKVEDKETPVEEPEEEKEEATPEETSEPKTDDVAELTKKVSELSDMLTAQDKIMRELRTERDTERAEYTAKERGAMIDGLVEAGKFLPANKDSAMRIFGALDGVEPLKFKATDAAGQEVDIDRPAVDEFTAFLNARPKVVEFSELSKSEKPPVTKGDIVIKGNNVAVDGEDVNQKILQFMEANAEQVAVYAKENSTPSETMSDFEAAMRLMEGL